MNKYEEFYYKKLVLCRQIINNIKLKWYWRKYYSDILKEYEDKFKNDFENLNLKGVNELTIELKKKIRGRDKYKKIKPDYCSKCHVKTTELDQHHLNYRFLGNYVYLCKSCHKEAHNKKTTRR